MSRATPASRFRVKPKPSAPPAVRTRATRASAPEATRSEWTCVCATVTGAANSAPDVARDFDHALELAPLLVDRERVAVVRAGEAALRRDAKVFQGDVFFRFVDFCDQRFF